MSATREVPQTVTVRGRDYVLFDVYGYKEVALKVADQLKVGGRLVHVVAKRGKNAVYHRP